MKRKIRLTESELISMIKRIVSEQGKEPVKYFDPELKDKGKMDPNREDTDYKKILSNKLKGWGFEEEDSMGNAFIKNRYNHFIQWGYPDLSDETLNVGVTFYQSKPAEPPVIKVYTMNRGKDIEREFDGDGTDRFVYDALKFVGTLIV